MGSHRRRRRRVVRALLWGVAALQVLEAVKLRARREQLRRLPSAPAASPETGKLSVSALGGDVDQATLRAVAAEMETSDVDVIDLVPGDLPAERALALLRRVDLDRLRDDPCYAPSGACEALVLDASVAERMGLVEGVEQLDRGLMARRTIHAQRYAPFTSTVRVAPGLRAARLGPADRWRELDELTGFLAGPIQGFELLWLALLTAGPWLAPLPGLAALATWCAQPALVFGDDVGRQPPGSSPTEPDVGPEDEPGLTLPDVLGTSLLRLPRAWVDRLTTAAAGIRTGLAAMAQKPETGEPVAGFDGRFEPRRETCRWCGSTSLDPHITVPDLLQSRPGSFHLDRCHDCGHVFQNPQLTPEGLDLAYSDSYDGAGAESSEWLLARCQPSYWDRANLVGRFTQPDRWLDVGCAHGFFFLVARQVFPETRFHGLDVGDTVEEGRRRGWIDAVHQGFFTDLADDLPTYDVVSMHHYLEHTRDPHSELAAAQKVVESGGYLMVEVPDPESPWARRLGRYWWQWGQPQHLNFMRCDNLVEKLTSTGFEVLSVERGRATFGNDLLASLFMWAQSVSRPTRASWLPPATPADRAKRAAAMSALFALLPAAKLVDEVHKARAQKTDTVSNVYRVLARKA